MLHNGEEPVLFPCLALSSAGPRQPLFLNVQDSIELHKVFHLDQAVHPNKALQVNAKHIWQFLNELLVGGLVEATLNLVVFHLAAHEVSIQTLLECVAITRDFQVQNVERFVDHVYFLRAFDNELGSELTSENVPND